MAAKKKIVSEFYHNPFFRLSLIVLIIGLFFLPLEKLFFIVLILNIPHALLNSYRQGRSVQSNQTRYIMIEVFTLSLALVIGYFSSHLLFYLAFIRFAIHFFEDDFFNLGFKDLALSILFLSLVIIDDLHWFSPNFKPVVVSLGIFYFLLKTSAMGPRRFLDFYFVYLILMFFPLVLNRTYNGSTWGYTLGVVHALMWLSWDGFGRSGLAFEKFSVTKMLTSTAFLATTIFTLLAVGFLAYVDWNYQTMMNDFIFIFHAGLFFHVFSKDFQRLFTFEPKKRLP